MVNLFHTIKMIVGSIKLLYFKLRHNKIHVTSEIGNGVKLRGNDIGTYCHIGPYCVLNNTTVGNYTCIAPSCQIGGMEHSYWTHSISPKLSSECISDKRTTIGHDVWLAAGVIVRQGVTIGDGAIIGANSFVNTDIPPYAIAYGTPAKVKKYRFNDHVIDSLNKSEYWTKPPRKAKLLLSKIEL